MKIAAIDIGSNSVRLLVMDHSGRDLYRDVTVTGLGRGIDATGRFRDETVARTLDVMRRYAVVIAAHDVSCVGAVATSASRDASNGPDLMDAIEHVVGTRPRIIDGSHEAELSFRGATTHVAGEPPILVVDVGGGSTEFVYGSVEPEFSVSTNVGSVRLSDQFLPDRPPTALQLAEASAHVDAVFSSFDLPGAPRTVIGVAGTFTSLTAIVLRLERYDRKAVHGSVLTRSDVKESIAELSVLTVEQTAAIPSLDPDRAPAILAGAVIADRAMLKAGVDRVITSEYGLLDGLARQLITGE